MTGQVLQHDASHAVTVNYSATVAKHRFVSWAGAHATDAMEVQGVSELAGVAGVAGSVVTGYSYPVEAAGAIPAGSAVAPSSDGTGRAVVATGPQCGRALTAATAAGQLVTVRVQLAGGGLAPAKVAASDALVSQDGILPRADTLFPPEKVQLTVTGSPCAAPCLLHRIRCIAGTSIALVVYDNPFGTSGTQLYSGTLSAGEEADIPTPIRAINGPRGVFSGTATFEYYVSQEI